MTSRPIFTARELCRETWSDFVRLFSQGHGWDHCWCMHFQRPCSLPKALQLPTRSQRGARNRREKKALLDKGCAHGILVYAGEQPVGWCQFGPQAELPRIDNSRKYQALRLTVSRRKLWRITCFVVDKRYRRKGVATAALTAALQSIRNRGGGLVEAYPITHWESRAFGNESTHGTASMFKKAGFKIVAPYGETRFSTHVLMCRTI